MDQQVQALSAKPDDLSLISKSHVVEELIPRNCSVISMHRHT